MLIAGKEEEFWTFFMESECYNPIALSRQALREWVDSARGPGGLRGILETYRADLVNRMSFDSLATIVLMLMENRAS